MPMPTIFSAQIRHFEYYSTVVDNIQEQTRLGGNDYILGLSQFNVNSQNIQLSFSWLANSFASNQVLAQKCCNFVLKSRPFLINFAPNNRLEWLDVAYRASQLIQDNATQLTIILEMGSAYWFAGNYSYAVKLASQVINLYKAKYDESILATAYGLIGLAKSDIGDTNGAIEYLHKALLIFKEDKQRSIYLPILGKCYDYTGNVPSALSAYKESLLLAHKAGDLRNKADIIGNIGISYSRMGNKRKSLHLFFYALKLARRVYDKRGESNQWINMANVFAKMGELRKADLCINKALPLCVENQNLKGKFKCNLVLFRCSLYKKDFFSALQYIKIIYQLAKQLNIFRNYRKVLRYI